MTRPIVVLGVPLLVLALVACKSVSHTDTAAAASSEAMPAPADTFDPQPEDENVYALSPVGFSIRKPPSWYFVPSARHWENLEQVQLQDEQFAEQMRKHSSEPLVVINKYDETAKALNPVFKVILRPLGQLSDRRLEDVAALVLRSMPPAFEDFEVVEDIESLQVSGHPAVHFAAKFIVRDSAGNPLPTFSEQWIVRRGDHIFLLGGSGPPEGEDASRDEYDAMVQSVVIEPDDF